MQNKQKIIIAIIILLVTISLVYIFISIKKTQTPVNITPSKPNLVQKYQGKYSVTLSLNKTQFNLPEKLPFLELESSRPPLTRKYANSVASHIGFTGEPMIINDPLDGATYFWKKGDGTLFIYLKSRKIRFSINTSKSGINKQLSDPDILASVQKYITDNQILDAISFQTGTITYLGKSASSEGLEETSKDKAILYQVSILPKITNYEIISLSSVEPTSYVQLTLDGLIYSFQISILPVIRKGVNEYSLKTFDQIKSSIDQAVLIELRAGTSLLSDLPTDLIQNIEITKVEIAYLVESSYDTSYQPVYKLSGKATIKNSGEKPMATLYLPAFSSNP